MHSRMERYNSSTRNRSFNRTLNGSNFIPTNMPVNGILSNIETSSLDTMIDLNIPYYPEDTELDGLDCNEIIHNQQGLFRRGGISISETPRTVSDFVSSVRNTSLISSESLLEDQLGIDIHEIPTINSQSYIISPQSAYPISARHQAFSQRDSSSMLQSPSLVHQMNNSSFVETPSILHIPRTNNSRSSLQMQNLWLAPTTSSSQTTHISGASRIAPLENSTHLTFSEQHTNFHYGSSSSSRNKSNIFIQPSVTHTMMRDLSESSLRYQSNIGIQPSSGPVRYLSANGVEDTINTANIWTNNIDPPTLPLVIGEGSVTAYNRERLLSEADSVREPGHIDNPIIIEDDEEDEHGDSQQSVIFNFGSMTFEALLELQEHIGDAETRLTNKVISKLLKQRKYKSTKMNYCNNSCCVCLDTYADGEELGKIDCGHEFHYHCISKWLKIKNFCPLCKRTALTS